MNYRDSDEKDRRKRQEEDRKKEDRRKMKNGGMGGWLFVSPLLETLSGGGGFRQVNDQAVASSCTIVYYMLTQT